MASGILTTYIKAGYPVIWVHTQEEQKLKKEIIHSIREVNKSLITKQEPTISKITTWSHVHGLHEKPLTDYIEKLQDKQDQATENPYIGLKTIYDKAINGNTHKYIYYFADLHKFIDNPKILRILRDISYVFSVTNKTLIISSPVCKFPSDIKDDITVIDLKLSNVAELKENVWENFKKEDYSKRIPENEVDKVLEAAVGLPEQEICNVIAKSIQINRTKPETSIIKLVLEEKASIIKKTGILEYYTTDCKMSDIGGLSVLKKWIDNRKYSYTKEAQEFGLTNPKGIILAGLPGCGKSLTAKCISSILNVPLIKFDLSRVFGQYVGQSEEQMRIALSTIDAIGHSVVWIDELEKVFSNKSNDGNGVKPIVLGMFLNWLQERQPHAFVIPTVNIMDDLPSALIRKGRFDEIFFVGLPDEDDRREIFNIHITKKNRNIKKLIENDTNAYEECIKQSEGFSGSEIEWSINTALMSAFNQRRKNNDNTIDLSFNHILTALKNVIPLSESQKPDLDKMIKWSEENAINASIDKNKKLNYKRHLAI